MTTIAQLLTRYGLSSRQSVYNRLDYLAKLGLERNLDEGSSFLTELDNLHVYLQQKGAMMEGYTLTSQVARVQVVNETDGQSNGFVQSGGEEGAVACPSEALIVPNLPPMWLTLIEAIASRLAPPLPDPLRPQRQLQEIAAQEWEVSTGQLASILGTRNLKDGEQRYGFRLFKVGRVGRQSAWKILKTRP